MKRLEDYVLLRTYSPSFSLFNSSLRKGVWHTRRNVIDATSLHEVLCSYDDLFEETRDHEPDI